MWASGCHGTCRTANLSNDLMNSSFCYLVRLCSGQKTISSLFLPVVSLSQPSGLCCWVGTFKSQLGWHFIFYSLVNFSVVSYWCTNTSSCHCLFVPVQTSQSQDGLRWWWKSFSPSSPSPASSYVGFPRVCLYAYALTWPRGACSWSWM